MTSTGPLSITRREVLIATTSFSLPTTLLAVNPPPSTESTPMSDDSPPASKQARPPESTLAFRAQARRLATIYGALAFSGDADRDFMALMTPLNEAMAGMAMTEMTHGRDSGLRAIARRLTELATAIDRELADRKPR